MLPILFAVSSIGGVAGGIIVIPIGLSLLQMSTKVAIPISSTIVCESALARFVLFSAYAGHPQRENTTQIDYNLVRIVYPAFLAGSLVGALVSVALGELWLAILISLLLVYLTINVGKKALKLYQKESEQFKKEAEQAKAAADANTAEALKEKELKPETTAKEAEDDQNRENVELKEEIKEEEKA